VTVTHEVFLLDVRELQIAIDPYIEELKKGPQGWDKVRARAIELFEVDPMVRTLADEYGGWDKFGIETDFPDSEPYEVSDVAFWLVLCLYHHLSRVERKMLGFGGRQELFAMIVGKLGWNEYERNLLVQGRSFYALFEAPFTSISVTNYKSNGVGGAWDYLGHAVRSGSVGWLDLQGIYDLHKKVVEDRHKVASLHISWDFIERSGLPLEQGSIAPTRRLVSEVYQAAIDMLNVAIERRRDLCLIISA